MSFKQFVKFVERLKRPERPTLKTGSSSKEEEKKKTKKTQQQHSSSLQNVRLSARNEERKNKKKKKKESYLGDDSRESLKRSLLELQKRVERNLYSSSKRSSSKMQERIEKEDEKEEEEEEDNDEILTPAPQDAHVYRNNDIVQYYRVVVHKDIVKEEQSKEALTSSRMIALAQSRVIRGLVKSKERFSLILLPDFFDTIETLSEFATPLSRTMPECPILVLSQPRPRSKKIVLSNKMIAKHLNKLLRQVVSNSHIVYPCIAVGFGNGGNVLMHHLVHVSKQNDRLIRAAMVVNSFAHVNKPLRQNLTQLLKMPRVASHQEKIMFLGALLFSDEFLRDKKSRDKLRDFFRGRNIFSRRNNELSDVISCVIRGA